MLTPTEQGLLLPDIQLNKDMKMTNDIQPNSEPSAGGSSNTHVVGSTVILGDCVEVMKGFEDNQFDLAVVDPPYGIGEGNKKNKTRSSYTGFGDKKTWVNANDYGGGEFDNSIPDKEYFDQLFRVSKNQIIWGANYMVDFIPPSMGWIFWDKDNGGSDQSDGELAFTSFERGLRKYTFKWQGLLQQNMKDKEKRIHPTQKPKQLYKWILQRYAKEGDKILDTHLGSGSSRIAAYELGFEFYGIELDEHYFNGQEKRFNNYKSQLRIEGW